MTSIAASRDTLPSVDREVHDAPDIRTFMRLALLCMLVHAALIAPVFTPTLGTLGMWDESVYINQGQELLAGQIPAYTANPLTAIFYAAVSLPVRGSPYWMQYTAGVGRAVLFVLLWVGALLVARRARVAPVGVVAGLLILSPAIPSLLVNGSDALFAALAAFGLAQLLAFRRSAGVRDAAIASALVGLAALARNEGPVLFVLLLGMLGFFGWRRVGLPRLALAAVLPFVLIVGGWVALHTTVTGELRLGTGDRAYFAFEQGEGWSRRSTYAPGADAYVEGQLDARRLYGTAEENDGSVLRAIQRNPGAYLQRLSRVVRQVPADVIHAHGGLTGIVIGALALVGLAGLVRRREWTLILALCGWYAFLVLQLLIVYRIQHTLLPYAPIMVLASVGVLALAGARSSPLAVRALPVSGAVMLLAGVALSKPALILLGALLSAGMLLLWWSVESVGDASPTARRMTLAGLFALGVLLSGGFTMRPLGRAGADAEDRAMLALRERLPQGSLVAAGAPGMAWAARMQHAEMHLRLRELPSPEALFTQLRAEGVRAIYVSEHLRGREPAVWALVEPRIGHEYEEVFNGDDGRIRVLMLSDEETTPDERAAAAESPAAVAEENQ